MSDNIIRTTHFKDNIATEHLMDSDGRLPGRDGTPGTGLKISEALPLAEMWWGKIRSQMPDFGKPPEQVAAQSPIMMGWPWLKLDKQEMLRVIAQWYAHVGVHLILEGKSTSQDNTKADKFGEIRESGEEIFPILNSDGTHAKVDDKIETETWSEEYKAIEEEEKLVDASGDPLKGE